MCIYGYRYNQTYWGRKARTDIVNKQVKSPALDNLWKENLNSNGQQVQ